MSEVLTYLAIYLAVLTQIAAFFCNKALISRLILLIAMVLYIAYFYFYPAEPLWSVIIIAGIFSIVILITFGITLFYRNSIFSNKKVKEMYHEFDIFNYDEFYKLIKAGTVQKSADNKQTKLVGKGEAPTILYYIMDDGITIMNEKSSLLKAPKMFIGEIVYLLGGTSDANVLIPPNTNYVAWSHDNLAKLSPQQIFKLKTLIASDDARKARSIIRRYL